jgi:hypothetical protein
MTAMMIWDVNDLVVTHIFLWIITVGGIIYTFVASTSYFVYKIR